PDAVRVGRVKLDPSRVRLDDRQRELGPGSRRRIEAGDLVRRLLGQPNHLRPRIGNRDIRAVVLGRRIVLGHLAGLVIDFHELAGFVEADPEIAVPIRCHPARNVYPARRVLIELPGLRIETSDLVRLAFGKPYAAVGRDIHSVSARVLRRDLVSRELLTRSRRRTRALTEWISRPTAAYGLPNARRTRSLVSILRPGSSMSTRRAG